ncbi:MAG: ester cyclase, partial [Thermoanaerobaculia bacterium]
ATTPGAANVKILDSFSAGDRVVTRFQYNVKGSDVEGGGSGSATLTALCVARLVNGKVVEATIEQDTTPLLKLGGGGGGTSSSGGGAEQVAQQFKRALESGNVDGLSGLFASNLSHDLDRSGIETNLGDASKLADVARYAVNANVKFLDQVVNGDQIVTRFQYDVDGNNVPGAARGSRATVTAVCIARVENGKIAEANIEQDTAGIYLQLGLGIADSKTS